MNGNDTISKKQLERLLWRSSGMYPDYPKVFIGLVPDLVPFPIPFPEKATLLGAIAQSPNHIAVQVDVLCSAQEILDYYVSHYLNAGWSRLNEELFQGGRGFQMLPVEPTHVTLCKTSKGPSVTVSAIENPKGPTQVHLLVECDPYRSRCEAQLHRRIHPMASNILPSLPAPPNSRPLGGGGGKGHTYQKLITKLNAEALLNHYSTLLENAGWKALSTGQPGRIPHAIWQFEVVGEVFHAILVVIQLPDVTDVSLVELHWFPGRASLRDDNTGTWSTSVILT